MKKISVCYLILLLFGCTHKPKNVASFGLFDVSKNDKNILFSAYLGNKSSIYQIDTDGKNLKTVVPSDKDSSYFNPKYNKTGDKIAFIGSSNSRDDSNSIYVANADGSNRHQIVKSDEIVSEVYFSECEEKLYFIGSKAFTHSSPLGRNALHGSDIFCINLVNKNVAKITDLEAHRLFRINEYKCQSIITNIASGNFSGIVQFPKSDYHNMHSIIPVRPPQGDNNLFGAPIYSNKFNLLSFILPYELYVMNMDDRKAKIVVRSDENLIEDACFFNQTARIVYTTQDNMIFNIINVDGSNKKNIVVTITS